VAAKDPVSYLNKYATRNITFKDGYATTSTVTSIRSEEYGTVSGLTWPMERGTISEKRPLSAIVHTLKTASF
jgi:hypothetical protein